MISIDVGSSEIKILDLKVGSKDISIQKVIEIPTDISIMNGDFGLDVAMFKNAIKEELLKINSKDVVITFSCLPHVSNVFSIPMETKENKIKEMIKSKVFQTLSPKQYIMDYRVVDVFKEAESKKCTVMVFMVPRKLVEDTMEAIISLGKKPYGFMTAQNNAYDFAKRYFKNDSLIMTFVYKNKIDAHLINFPDNLITRTTYLDTGSGNVGGLDILAEINDVKDEKMTALEDIVSKLQQYQTIKYPGKEIEGIYLMGNDTDKACKSHLEAVGTIPIYLLDEMDLLLSARQQSINDLVYAVGAGINVWR